MANNMALIPPTFRHRYSIRTHILFAVNVAMAICTGAILTAHYVSELSRAESVRRAGLQDEAVAVGEAVSHFIRQHDDTAVQSYINAVCNQMCQATSPEHAIRVETETQLYDCQGCNSQITGALDNSKDSSERITGIFTGNGIKILVSESSNDIRQAARQEVWLQMALLAGLALMAAVVVNVVVGRYLHKPLRILLEALSRIGNGAAHVDISPIGSVEMQRLAQTVNVMGRSLKEIKHQRESQMRRAREIQQNLLPSKTSLPFLRTAFVFRPAEEVSGDYFDFLPHQDGTWFIALADVTGHGVPAALGASILKTLLLNALEEKSKSPAEVLASVNRRFCGTIASGMFASMFLAKWNPCHQTLAFASAGHESAMLINKDKSIEALHSTGLLLGIDEHATWANKELALKSGQRLFLYSDGAIEGRNQADELFGRNRLQESLLAVEELSPQGSLERLEKIIIGHNCATSLEDDLTMLMLEVDLQGGDHKLNPAIMGLSTLFIESGESRSIDLFRPALGASS